jgi:hypothetical protein
VHPGNKLIGFICGLVGARTVARSGEIGPKLLTSRPSDRLDLVHAAAIPLLPDPGASWCSELVEQTGHRILRPMQGDQFGALEGGLPLALAAGDEDHFARLVGQPVERALDRHRAGGA